MGSQSWSFNLRPRPAERVYFPDILSPSRYHVVQTKGQRQ